tara:strand:+ start:60 stop:575 length:516 start_codon:yes stop_codon:yes gene_type:complete
MPEQGLQNRFDAPIPGESLTDTPGNAKWEHPPQFTKVEEASEYIWDRLHDEKLLEQVIAMLREGVPVEALARVVLFGGFTEGKWAPDLAILLAEIVFKQIIAIGMAVKIKNMKIFMGDQSNTQFRRNFGRFKMFKEKGKKDAGNVPEAKEFAEEIKEELESPSGLMAKETE